MIRSIALVAIVPLLAAATWLGWRAYDVYSGINTMTHVVAPRTPHEHRIRIPPIDSSHRINILVLGSDNDQKKEEAQPPTQSMIVVTIDPKNDKVGLLSIPRDFWVPIRGHGYAKIDLAYKFGHVPLARETVEKMLGIQIDYYAWVGLQGFVRVINTFNGVTIDASEPVLDDRYPADLTGRHPYAYARVFIPPGWQHMGGQYALEYVRSRHGELTGDFGRSARQQQVLVQLQQKITALNVLTHLPSLIDDLRNSVRTDLTVQQIYQLDQLSHRIHHADITQVVLQAPTYSSFATADGQDVVFPNWAKIRPLVKRMFAPIAPVKSPGPKPTPTAAPKVTSTVTPTATPIPTATATPQASTIAHPPGNVLYVANGNLYEATAGGAIRQLTYQGDAAMPSPSPNGHIVAFVRFTTGLERFGKYASDIWLLDARSGRQHIITRDEAANPSNNLWALWPTWSPNGKTLMFSSDRQKLTTAPSDLRPADLALYMMPAVGGRPTQITTPQHWTGGDTDPVWRPGNGQALFVRWHRLPPTNQPYSQLALLDVRTRHETALTQAGGRVIQPSWDAGGRRVAFVRRKNGIDQIVVSRLTARRGVPQLGRRTVIAQGQVAQPAFSPNGRWISFVRVDGDGFSIYVERSRGGRPEKITSAGNEIDARWRPVWLH